MVKINNYFYEPTDYKPDYIELGESKRSPFTGTIHSFQTTDYHTFQLKFEQLEPEQLEHFEYLNNLSKGKNSLTQENLSFTDLYGNSYTVIIPINGYKPSPESGETETYTVNLTLEEVIT